MTSSKLHDRLLQRELGKGSSSTTLRKIYGDRAWVKDLDIVNELGGHSGCVNALNWSKGGGLLASGSDDQNLNIHSYQPDDSNKPFKFTTTVDTGHQANIFSVKFMPHSNDRTVVTVAGDADVRIFDIEHSGGSTRSNTGGNSASNDRAGTTMFNGAQYLSQGDTNARVYRSHSDRVKRIVTESSPHLFLTCSEDGEVRQWDLRQPSSAYPRPRSGRMFPRGGPLGDAPPALISYKRHRLDLNTISCSPSQPHYIALGGRHLHCFLHDRRMLGRNQPSERGSPGESHSTRGHSNHEDNRMDEATRCVKRFAPNGKQTMGRNDDGHITACKISDANPNEIVVSWSGDYIYDFDMMRVPDARDLPAKTNAANKARRKVKESSDRKRKRTKTGSAISQERAARDTRPRTSAEESAEEEIALRIRYGNGQSENIPIQSLTEDGETHDAVVSPEQQQCFKIASDTVKMRQHLFSPQSADEPTIENPTGHASAFSMALEIAAKSLEGMSEIIRRWRYPVDPDEMDVQLQKTLKRNRESAWRFVQACGTISRLLGGKTGTDANAIQGQAQFAGIKTAPNEGEILDDAERFRYDFLKAITLWLTSGPTALVEGFTQKANNPRFPIPRDASIDAIDTILIPYLLDLAGDAVVPNLAASRFEVDENRTLFVTERHAVIAFAQALKIPFEDLSSGAVVPAPSTNLSGSTSAAISLQDRKTALKFWGFKVAKGILLNAGEHVSHVYVDRAFGGLGQSNKQIRAEERALQRQTENIDPDEEEQTIESVGILRSGANANVEAVEGQEQAPRGNTEDSDVEMIPIDNILDVASEAEQSGPHDEHEDGDEASEDDIEEDDDEAADDDASITSSSDEEEDASDNDEGDPSAPFLTSSMFTRSARRSHVQKNTPCVPHIRTYRGHCNVKTVKDVNFYGLNDEYVVSGSDSGHLFIWDRESQELLNILEGDREVVNVVQGHPYEPMLAVSGIDHTIKIFSPDSQMRSNARKGINLSNDPESGYSSLRTGRRLFGARPTRDVDGGPHATEAPTAHEEEEDITDDGETEETGGARAPANRGIAPNGLSSRRRMHMEYQITSQNDVERRGGNNDGFATRSLLARLLGGVAGGLGGEDGDEDDESPDAEGAGEGGTGGRRRGGFRLGIVRGRLVLSWMNAPDEAEE